VQLVIRALKDLKVLLALKVCRALKVLKVLWEQLVPVVQ
jgi:hypothetical protein